MATSAHLADLEAVGAFASAWADRAAAAWNRSADAWSTSGAAASEERVKSAACWPFHELLRAACTSRTSAKLATGTTGPNCSSTNSRMPGATPSTTAGV